MAGESKNTPAKHSILQKVSRRKLVLAVLVLLGEVIICISETVLGVWVHISIENVGAGAFWAPVLLLIGALVSLEGILFPFGRQKMLAMGVMLQILGIFMALIGAFLESVVASLIHNVDFSRCSYSGSGVANCTAELSCEAVQLSFPKSCYCCYLTKERFSPCYFRAVSLFEAPSLYAGVDSCEHVSGEYLILLWTSVCFCVICCFFGIIAAVTTYSYRKAVKPPSISISTTVTSPMLPKRSHKDGFVKSSSSSSSSSTPSGGSPSLDVPVPAPRNSLVRSSSNTVVGSSPAAATATTSEKSSTLPKRKKRRAPDIPTAQTSANSEESRPSSSTSVVVVRPKSNSAALHRQSRENRLSGNGLRPSSAERPKSMDSRQVIRVSRSTENILREARTDRPRAATSESRPAPRPQRRPDSQGSLGTPTASQSRTQATSSVASASASRTNAVSGTPTANLSSSQASSGTSPASSSGTNASLRTPTASPSRTVSRVSDNQEESQRSSHEVATPGSSSGAGASASASPSTSTDTNTSPKSENATKSPAKKWRSNKKCPAPLTPPQLQQLQQEKLKKQEEEERQVLAALEASSSSSASFLPSNDPIPRSPPPPFVPDRPPSPPPFTPSASIHYPHHPPHHPHQPVTNIHLTLTTTPMGANVQMPVAGQSGYLFQSQPTAPYL